MGWFCEIKIYKEIIISPTRNIIHWRNYSGKLYYFLNNFYSSIFSSPFPSSPHPSPPFLSPPLLFSLFSLLLFLSLSDSYYLGVGTPGTCLYLLSFLSYFLPLGFCFVFALYCGRFSKPYLSTFVMHFSNLYFHFWDFFPTPCTYLIKIYKINSWKIQAY